MIDGIKDGLWKQFGAAIDMLKNAVTLWPEEQWNANKKLFYITYHCLVFLDYYLTVLPANFTSPLPFTIMEEGEVPADALDDVIPDRIYTREELLDYLQLSRQKCYTLIAALNEEKLQERWIENPGNMNYSVLEILLYNMRHVQHHAAQLNLLLRQAINDAPGWVARANEAL